MKKSKTSIEIESEYHLEIERIVSQSSQFETVSDYVDFVLKEMLFGDTDAERAEVDDAIKKRLQSLGYM